MASAFTAAAVGRSACASAAQSAAAPSQCSMSAKGVPGSAWPSIRRAIDRSVARPGGRSPSARSPAYCSASAPKPRYRCWRIDRMTASGTTASNSPYSPFLASARISSAARPPPQSPTASSVSGRQASPAATSAGPVFRSIPGSAPRPIRAPGGASLPGVTARLGLPGSTMSTTPSTAPRLICAKSASRNGTSDTASAGRGNGARAASGPGAAVRQS